VGPWRIGSGWLAHSQGQPGQPVRMANLYIGPPAGAPGLQPHPVS
jgi:hypothetical protein